MTRKPPTVRSIRSILRKAGVPLSEFRSEAKHGPRRTTVGADVYSPHGRHGMLLSVVVEWFDGRWHTAKLPDDARAALDAAGYVTDASGLVHYKDLP